MIFAASSDRRNVNRTLHTTMLRLAANVKAPTFLYQLLTLELVLVS